MDDRQPVNGQGGIRQFVIELWRQIWLTDQRAVQVVTAMAAMLASAFIGAVYAFFPFVSVYPILFWLLSVGVCFGMLYPVKGPGWTRDNRLWLGLAGLLFISFLLRVIKLNSFPPGFHADESGTVDFALRHVFHPEIPGETINPFRTGTDSQPVLYAYVLYASMRMAGYTFAGARLSSVIAGALAVPAVFMLVNELAGRRMAWLSAILMAVYHYHIHWSRIALNNIWGTLLMPLALGFFLFGWRKGWAGGALVAGLCLGLSAYFYAGGYVVIFLMFILIWQTWRQTKNRLSLGIYAGKMLVQALVVALPLMAYASLFPDSFLDRSRVIAAWKPLAIEVTVGKPDAYWDFFVFQLIHSFGAYNFYSDVSGFYAPDIPFLIGVASLLFLLGFVWALYKKQFFPVTWVALVTVLGGFMVVGPPASSHYIAVIPAICWLAAIPLDWLFENKHPYWAYFLLAAIILLDLYFYFVVYAAHPSGDLTVPFPLVEPYTY